MFSIPALALFIVAIVLDTLLDLLVNLATTRERS